MASRPWAPIARTNPFSPILPAAGSKPRGDVRRPPGGGRAAALPPAAPTRFSPNLGPMESPSSSRPAFERGWARRPTSSRRRCSPRRPGRPIAQPAPRGQGRRRRAYLEHGISQAPQPVKSATGAPTSLRGAAGRPLRQFNADRSRRSAPTILARRESILLSPSCSSGAVAGVRLAVSSLGTPRPARLLRRSARYCSSTRSSSPTTCARARPQPAAPFDSDHHPGTREAVAGAPRLLDSSTRTTPPTSRTCARSSTGRGSPTRSTRPCSLPRLLHRARVRVLERRARRAGQLGGGRGATDG